jgi:hypothetical protein
MSTKMIVVIALGALILGGCGEKSTQTIAPADRVDIVLSEGRITYRGTDSISALNRRLPVCSQGNYIEQSFYQQGLGYTLNGNTLDFSMADFLPMVQKLLAQSSQEFNLNDLINAGSALGLSLNPVFTFTRQGSGSGLNGLWNYSSFPQLSYLTLFAETRDLYMVIAGFEEIFKRDKNGAALQMRITQDSVVLVIEREAYGELLLTNLVDTAGTSLKLVHPSAWLWDVIGKVSAETATVAIDELGNTTFNMAALTHTFFREPTPAECPNNPVPQWFLAFLQNNP